QDALHHATDLRAWAQYTTISFYGVERTAKIGKTTRRREWGRGNPPTPPCPGGAAIEQAGLDGKTKQLGAALQAELVTQALAVGLDGLHAHGQMVGGFMVRVPLRQQPEHLGLPPAQRLGVPGSRRVAGDAPDLMTPR